LFELYISIEAFTRNDFIGFQHIIDLDYDQIQLKWSDMELSIEGQYLHFSVGSELIPIVHDGEKISCEGWASISLMSRLNVKGW